MEPTITPIRSLKALQEPLRHFAGIAAKYNKEQSEENEALYKEAFTALKDKIGGIELNG